MEHRHSIGGSIASIQVMTKLKDKNLSATHKRFQVALELFKHLLFPQMLDRINTRRFPQLTAKRFVINKPPNRRIEGKRIFGRNHQPTALHNMRHLRPRIGSGNDGPPAR